MAPASQILQFSAIALMLSQTATAQFFGGWGGWGNGGGNPWGGSGDGSSSSGSSGSSSSSGTTSGSSDFSSFASTSSFQRMNTTLTAHATLASLAWVFLFPLGSILLRVIHSKRTWMIHGAVQIIALLVFVVGAGLGIWLAKQIESFSRVWNDPHVIIGLVLLALAALQPISGFIHHTLFVRRGDGKRTTPGRAHLWLGRALIVLGMVNGGLGIRLVARSPLQSARTTRNVEIGYSVAAGVMFLLYALVALRSEIQRSRRSADAQWTKNRAGMMSDETLTSMTDSYNRHRRNDRPTRMREI